MSNLFQVTETETDACANGDVYILRYGTIYNLKFRICYFIPAEPSGIRSCDVYVYGNAVSVFMVKGYFSNCFEAQSWLNNEHPEMLGFMHHQASFADCSLQLDEVLSDNRNEIAKAKIMEKFGRCDIELD